MLILKLLLLLVVANGAPIIAKNVFGRRFAFPVDGYVSLADGQRLFGPTKTIRGILLSVVATLVCASLLGLDWHIGLIIGSAAMLGDLCSSFIKRRVKKPPTSMALGVDQIPESLFPMLACKHLLSLSLLDIVSVVVAFFIVELLLSRLLYKLHIRDKPY